jgi:hypothetical protein
MHDRLGRQQTVQKNLSFIANVHNSSLKRQEQVNYTIIVPIKCTSLLKAQDITICTFLPLYS